MISGQTKNIALPPVGFKELDTKETFVPFQIDLRNGKITKAGNWENRNGYAEQWDISHTFPIDLLIPVGNGYSVSENGRIYDLTPTPTRITGTDLTGAVRPQWAVFKDDILIVDGSAIVLDTIANTTEAMDGSPPAGRYIGRVGAYTLLAGYDDTEFSWSASNNPENWTRVPSADRSTGDAGWANAKKTGKIKYATDFNNKWFLFKDNEIEVWHNRGGSTPFVRLNELTIPIGLLASYSVVKTESNMYYLDNNKKFRDISGKQVTGQYESYIFDKIQNPRDVYGFDYPIEHCIRLFSPVDGICIKFDYENSSLTEDNTYQHGQYERLPHNSYMELNGKQYFGDYEPTGKVFEWSEEFKDDDGTEIRNLREFKVKLTEPGNLAKVNRLRFMLKRGVDTLTETNPQMLFRWRFDEDAEDVEWYTETIGLGIGTDTEPYVDLFGLGLGRTMHMQIIKNDATDFMLLGMLITTQENRI